MVVKSRRQADRSDATRAALIAAATPLFAARGFAGVGTEQIVRAAGVTRGALYHHFCGKQALFAAVAEATEARLVERIATSVMTRAGDPLSALHLGAHAMLDEAARDDAVRRIVLSDAPSVLGWQAWREILQRHGLGLIQATLQAAMDEGQIAPAPVQPLAHLLSGALSEAAHLVALADRREHARVEVQAAIDLVIDGLRAR
jgi:AcrR family transcriptional regulator